MEFNDPIISIARKGTSDSPFQSIEESLIVDSSAKVQLTEYPHRYNRVIVTGDSKDWYETDSTIPDESSYHVDYLHKIVTFNIANIGKQLQFKYEGVGKSLISANNIYTERDGLEVVDTLQTLTDTTREARDSANQTNENIQQAENVRKQNENTRKSEHTAAMNEVDEAITTANNRIDEVVEDTNTMIADTSYIEPYNATTTYKRNNVVSFNGHSFIAKQGTKGNPPPDPEVANENAYWGLAARKGADGTGTVKTPVDTFTATEGQKVFNLRYTYDQFQGRTKVTVGGVPQFTPEHYEETTSKSITLNEGVPAGTIVKVEYFSESVPLQSDIQNTVDNHTGVISDHASRLNNHDTELNSVTAQLAHTSQEVENVKTTKAEKSELDGTNLRIDNLVIPLSPENSNIEVTNALASVTKGKSFSTLSNRFEEVESDVIKENEKTDLSIVNMPINGFFEKDSTGWRKVDSTVTVSNGVLELLASSQNGRIDQSLERKNGHKYYFASRVKANTNQLGFWSGSVLSATIGLYSDIGNWQLISHIYTSPTTGTGWIIGISDVRTSGFDLIQINGFYLVDLTETFGVGKEPTKEEMDELIVSLGGNWYNNKPPINRFSMYQYDKLKTKVDRVPGKQLSTEDYTTQEKQKLLGIPDNLNLSTSRRIYKLTKPDGFNWDDIPITIWKTQDGKYVTDFDVATLQPTGKTYYVDVKNGNDSNDGLTLANALKSIKAATDKSDVKVVLVKGGIYNYQNGFFNTTLTKDITVKAVLGEEVIITTHEDNSWVLTSGKTNTYEVNRAGFSTYRILDTKFKDGNGDFVELQTVTSIEEVESTPGSCYYQSPIMYVHTVDSRPADSQVWALLPARNVEVKGAYTLYLEGLKLYGGGRCLRAIDDGNQPTVYAKDCEFAFSTADDAVNMEGAKFVVFKNCMAHHGKSDGFNYRSIVDGNIVKSIEIDCIGRDNGMSDGYNYNGSTSHGGCIAIRLNSIYFRNYGGNVADINAGTQSWNISCEAFESVTSNDEYNSNFTAHSNSEMWNENCVSYGSKNALRVELSATMKNRVGQLEGNSLVLDDGTLGNY